MPIPRPTPRPSLETGGPSAPAKPAGDDGTDVVVAVLGTRDTATAVSVGAARIKKGSQSSCALAMCVAFSNGSASY